LYNYVYRCTVGYDGNLFHQFTILSLLCLCRERGKKGQETGGKSAPCQHSKIGGKNEAQKNEKKAAGL
jgi:hypothetical protein